MVKVDRLRTRLLLGALPLVLLAGCAGSSGPSGDFPDMSLADTKSPTQLLRNEAAGRLPAEVIGDQFESEDVSVACLSEKEDPDGVIRSWHSTVRFVVTDESADVATVAKDLVTTFTDQGWSARDIGGNVAMVKKLVESEDSLADIQVFGLTPDAGRASTSTEEFVEVPTVVISVHGPCVRTGGPESEEVKALEART